MKLVYDFEWDIGKAFANTAKHGVTFDQAATVFSGCLGAYGLRFGA
jgi:uncharacterized DUF497 family protein